MNILRKLYLKGRPVPQATNYPIERAYTVGGVDYYAFVDVNNIPVGRALAAYPLYEELRMRTTREYLQLHCAAVDSLLNTTKNGAIQLIELQQLNNTLKERLDYIVEENTVMRLAAVLYFDSSESPHSYDAAHGEKKIAHWKKHKADFFLQMPIKNLTGYSERSALTLESYLMIIKEATKLQLDRVLSNLSDEQKRSDKVKSLTLQVQTLLE